MSHPSSLDSIIERAVTGDYAEILAAATTTSHFLASVLGNELLKTIQRTIRDRSIPIPEDKMETAEQVSVSIDTHLGWSDINEGLIPKVPVNPALIDYYTTFHRAGIEHTERMKRGDYGDMAVLILFIGKFGVDPAIGLDQDKNLKALGSQLNEFSDALDIEPLSGCFLKQYAIDSLHGIASSLSWKLVTSEGWITLTSASSPDVDALEELVKPRERM